MAGPLRQTRPAARFSGTVPGPPRGAPLIGQHNREVLREAGLSDGEIAALVADGAIGDEHTHDRAAVPGEVSDTTTPAAWAATP